MRFCFNWSWPVIMICMYNDRDDNGGYDNSKNHLHGSSTI